MDPASRIFDFLYLGSEWNASNLEVGNYPGREGTLAMNYTGPQS